MANKKMINITGAAESRIAPIAAKILKESDRGQCLVVVPSYIRGKRLAADLSFLWTKIFMCFPRKKRECSATRRKTTSLCWSG